MFKRLRRMRMSPELRKLNRETTVQASDLGMPLFVHEDLNRPQEISSMPGIFQMDEDSAVEAVERYQQLGLGAVILFGIPSKKDHHATGAWSDNGVVQKLLRRLKKTGLKIPLIADTCHCEYTEHGHCGPLNKSGCVDNDLALELLGKTASSQARAGADVIAPSIMIDGMVQTIRQSLDKEGFLNTPILSYGAKYASSFYGPFRDAAGSSGVFSGDRKNHQMDYSNSREALLELENDVAEGADMLMVKPAMVYLDIIKDATNFGLPVWAYNVSGEYSMVKAAVKMGFADEKNMVTEILTSIKRAGADRIITYHAEEFAKNV